MKTLTILMTAGLALFLASLGHAAEKLSGNPYMAKPIVDEKCAACHGPDGNSPVPNFPRLAGQRPEYLFKELKNFKEEHRISELMLPFVKELSEDDMANLALFFSTQVAQPAVVTKPELVPIGRKLYFEGNPQSGVPSCDGCHEEDGKGSGRFPGISGQNIEYTLEEFSRYTHDVRKTGAKQMRTVAKRLTPAEIEALAQFLASMK